MSSDTLIEINESGSGERIISKIADVLKVPMSDFYKSNAMQNEAASFAELIQLYLSLPSDLARAKALTIVRFVLKNS